MLAIWALSAACAAQGDGLSALLAERGLAGEPSGMSRQASALRERTADVVLAAMNFIGLPYREGDGNDRRGFDCSGFTRHIFALSLGLVLPRSADAQATASGLAPVEKADLQPGDLVFFNTLKRSFSHVGIYIGDGRFIHSPKSGSEVRIENMRYAYWAQRYSGARRVLAETVGAQTSPLSTKD